MIVFNDVYKSFGPKKVLADAAIEAHALSHLLKAELVELGIDIELPEL